MAYKLRVILDVEEDVIRDILISETITLEELHFTIAKSFGFGGQEMASFYRADDQWEQGDEIPLCNMSDDDDAFDMGNCMVSSILKEEGDKLIYVYDFYAMWAFFVELSEIKKMSTKELPIIALTIGITPKNAPEKEFISDDFDPFKDDFNQEDENFDNYGDPDSDEFHY
ncbi:hypothetical protein [Lutibacter sp.]|uniref:IS1096 element passenger TnpR family protein n=1 Tax=Lutibacter sp. TaxID=1925666 RepID=UPI002732A4AE|nr:hypothetical protein [Lutibacter sp.]MDP3312492.1 hypothetical protein [Lutibacter sp.]